MDMEYRLTNVFAQNTSKYLDKKYATILFQLHTTIMPNNPLHLMASGIEQMIY